MGRRGLDRFELLNRDDVFGWVAERKLPAVASGDFHRLEHLATWKTVLGCAKEEPAVVEDPVGPAVRSRAWSKREATRRVA